MQGGKALIKASLSKNYRLNIFLMESKGIFITFEGGEGCGKTTQIALLCEYFAAKGFECVITREPGGTKLAEKIRELLLDVKESVKIFPKAELLLFEAARAQHVEELIKPALSAGKVVISDRFFDSSSAYQGGARGLGAEFVKTANLLAAGDCVPSLTILLDVSAAVGLARASLRDGGKTDRMGSESVEFYESVRAAFLKLAAENSDRFVVVGAEKSPSEIASKIQKIIAERFNV